MCAEIMSSGVIISRAGYTSIMDFVHLKKPAILIPTPGQTEQEYLAEHLSDKQMFLFCEQKAFDLESAREKFHIQDYNFVNLIYVKQASFLDIIRESFYPAFLDDDKCSKL